MPALAFNLLQNPTERSERAGLAMLAKGMFGTFRDTTARRRSIGQSTSRKGSMRICE
jgi:hypothetical protein